MPYLPQETWVSVYNLAENEGSKNPSHAPNIPKPRASGSAADVLDDQVGVDSAFATLQPGTFRTLWRQPEIIISGIKVISTKSSTAINQGSQNGVYQAGLLVSPVTTLSTNSVVPDMGVSLRTTSQVQVTAIGQFSPSTSTANCVFTLYRDNIQVGRAFTYTGSTAYVVNLSLLDNPPVGQHQYTLQWNTSAGTLTASGINRSMQALNLQPR